ncbi:MAG: XRE family transcriptional regulator [Capnocytophaga sp.]|uniref:helix-turn-helix domain-containing protein n=1 Tax=uncultured Capnocytophaga sp. TaxID=159273 RepID=UPI000F23196D|nr:helix-turn-helix transcriptional regulator [uncultured Capnocytophaga sp.]RKW10336.1 MAG: XRE family transcriptional regulator [Capnocytophaga sp.]
MFDQQEFIARIQKIMNYYSLTASALADQLGVLRSSISHLLSERNKPSLDFVLKIINKYPEIDLYWLLYGKGTFPKEEVQNPKESIPNEIIFPPSLEEKSYVKQEILEEKEIQKIVFFYKDKTFDIFENF